jgi:hypothetical protein
MPPPRDQAYPSNQAPTGDGTYVYQVEECREDYQLWQQWCHAGNYEGCSMLLIRRLPLH